MTAKGHMILSIPVATGLDFILNKYFFVEPVGYLFFIIFYLSVIVGSLLPDIDEPGSYIGRKLPIFSHIFSMFITHRGFTHYLIIPIMFLIWSYYTKDMSIKIAIYGLALGIFAHDCGDLLTRGGIKGFFFPFFRKHTFGLLPKPLRFYTGSIVEFIVVLLLIGINILLAIQSELLNKLI